MMPFVATGIFVPAAVALALAIACQKWLPRSVSRRYSLSVPLAAGFLAGYALLPSWAEWAPSRHWQWLTYLAGAAAVVGPIGGARGVWWVERWTLNLILAVAAARLLVPDWSSLDTTRTRLVVLLAAYLFVLTSGLGSLAERVAGRVLVPLLALITLVLAVAVLATVSVRYGQLAGVAAAALAGCCPQVFRHGDSMAVPSLAPTYAMLAGGLAFVGYLEPQPPLSGLLVLPAAPLAVWGVTLMSVPRDSRLAVVLQLISVAAVAGLAVGWLAWRT